MLTFIPVSCRYVLWSGDDATGEAMSERPEDRQSTDRLSNDAAKGADGFHRSAGDSLRLRTKMYFGVGAGGEAASMWVFNALALIFYQQILVCSPD